jgi:ferredoxin like protein
MTPEDEVTKKQNPELVGENLPPVFIDDVLMSIKYYVDEHEAHIRIKSQEVCRNCARKGCLYFCPGGTYQLQANGDVQVSYQSCIECGSCRVMCTQNNIEWKYPRGGFGVAYKFG